MNQQRLLVIEDDRPTREAIQRLFISKGWEVAMVVTLAEALALLRDYDAHWILTSSDLPDGPCDPIVPRLRSARKTTRIAVLTESKNPARFSVLKPDLMFQKPLDPEFVYRSCAQADGHSTATG